MFLRLSPLVQPWCPARNGHLDGVHLCREWQTNLTRKYVDLYILAS
jgi:hypothetical protein